MNTKNTIPCSVGVLTFNSQKTLRRTLDSVADFSNLIISDGGSTDDTLKIAQEYGCTVIKQHAAENPSADPIHPIADFSKERNRLIDAATEDWFLWIDSDEYISQELHDQIKEVTAIQPLEHYGYELPVVRQSPDATITYRPWKQDYQVRLFNLTTGGRFEKRVHERFMFDHDKFSTGRLNGAWYIPISKSLFRDYARAVHYRFRIMLEDTPPINPYRYFLRVLIRPLKSIVGDSYRALMMFLFFKKGERLPWWYTRNKMYSQLVIMCILTQVYAKVLYRRWR